MVMRWCFGVFCGGVFLVVFLWWCFCGGVVVFGSSVKKFGRVRGFK